jgi:predicted Zn-dependent protease
MLPTAAGGHEALSSESIEQLIACREAVRSVRLVEAREAVERALAANPTSFIVNAIHGEVLYRLGLYREASRALFRALVQPPTSWQAYQVVNHLYQESRSNERGSFERATDCAPPRPIAAALYWLARRGRWMARLRRLEATG